MYLGMGPCCGTPLCSHQLCCVPTQSPGRMEGRAGARDGEARPGHVRPLSQPRCKQCPVLEQMHQTRAACPTPSEPIGSTAGASSRPVTLKGVRTSGAQEGRDWTCAACGRVWGPEP